MKSYQYNILSFVNPIALRKAKIVCNFGISESHRVKDELVKISLSAKISFLSLSGVSESSTVHIIQSKSAALQTCFTDIRFKKHHCYILPANFQKLDLLISRWNDGTLCLPGPWLFKTNNLVC